MSELERAEPLKQVKGSKSYLFYGPGGTGKTLLATKHPGKKKLFIDVDERLHELVLSASEQESITRWIPGVTLGSSEIQFTTVDPTRRDVTAGTQIKEEPLGYSRTVGVVNELLALSYAAKKGGPAFPFDVVIVDSLTRVVDHLVYAVMYKHKVTNMTETLYGVEGRNLKEFIMGFLQLPCDRILIAHSMHLEKRNKEGAMLYEKIFPHVFGSRSIRDELVSLFSEAYYFLGRRGTETDYKIQAGSGRRGGAEVHARSAKGLEYETKIDAKKIFA